MENNRKGIFIITILCILVLGLGGYLVYDKVLSNKEAEKIEYVFNNDVFKKITSKSFAYMKVGKYDETSEISPYYDYYTITDYDRSLNIIKTFDKEKLTEIHPTGVGYSDYSIVIYYNDNGTLKNINIQSGGKVLLTDNQKAYSHNVSDAVIIEIYNQTHNN